MKRTVEEEIDSIVMCRGWSSRFVPMDTSRWTKPFEERLPFRLPPSFAALIRRYRFPSFVSAGITFFGNIDGHQEDDLVVQVFRDRIVSAVTQTSGFVQLGRPHNHSYDPICFDLRTRTKTGEASLVRLDHEDILINDRITVVETVSASFCENLR